MSAVLDEAIRLCKAEEQRLTEKVRQYKDILDSMKLCVKDNCGEGVAVCLQDNDISLKEQQEIELLEQVLKKALEVRRSSSVSSNLNTDCQGKPYSNDCANKTHINYTVADKRKPQKSPSSCTVKGSQQRGGASKCTGSRDVWSRHEVKKVPSAQSTMIYKRMAKKPQPAQENAGVDAPKKPCKTAYHSKKLDGEEMAHGLSVKERICSSEQKLNAKSEASPTKEQWVPSPLLPLWQAQRAEKTRLWKKVQVRHSKLVPQKEDFKKRLIKTFPTAWSSDHMAAMEAKLDFLTKQGHDLIHYYNNKLQLHQPGSNPDTSLEKEYESQLIFANLQKKMIEIIKHAKRLKKDWENKLAWCHESLCPLRSRSEWRDPEIPCLPPLLACNSRSELEELYTLRLQIDQLQLEICLNQTMCNPLLDQIPCKFSTECPSANVLRGVYSVLGEGGSHFPSMVMDTEQTQAE